MAFIHLMSYFEGKGVYIGGWVKRYTGLIALWRSLNGKPDEDQLYLRHNGPEHLLCFMPTRSGKGVGLILPTLLAWEGSSLVLDIKGENWALTSGWRQSQGHFTLRFDPSDPSGLSAAFNPLEEIHLDEITAIPDVQNIAAMLIDPQGKGLEDHWAKAGFALLSGALLHCCIMVPHKQKKPATLYDLACMLADETRKISELFDEMVSTDHAAILKEMYPNITEDSGKQAHVFVASAGREMLNKAENEGSGVVSTVLTNLSLYRDPVVCLNTSRSDFHIADLMNLDNPVDLYLVLSPADIDRIKPLIRLMLDMIIRRVCKKMDFADGASKQGFKHRLLFMLDEFTSLGKLPVMEKAIAYIAGYGGKMYIIVQDTVQLDGVYGKDNALMSNCHIRIAAAPNIYQTAQVLSDMTGKTTVVEQKTSLSGSKNGALKNASVSVSETARPLLTPDECMRIPGNQKDSNGKVTKPGDMLIFTAGQSTIYGRQILYFLDPTFSKRAKIPAPSVTDSIYYPREATASSSATQAPEARLPEAQEPAPAQEAHAAPTPQQPEVNYESYFA